MVTSDDEIKIKIFFSGHSYIMWNWWLVNWPVVVWRIVNRVSISQVLSSLGESVTIDSIDQDISKTKIFFSFETYIMWWRWLINWPIIVWRVVYWISTSHISFSLCKSKSIDSINCDISKSEIFFSIETNIVRWGWLVNWPVIEWRVVYWVGSLNKRIIWSYLKHFTSNV